MAKGARAMLGARSEDCCTAVALSLTGRDGWHVWLYRRSVTRDESSCYNSSYMMLRAISALFVLSIVLIVAVLGTLSRGSSSPSASEYAVSAPTSSAQRGASPQKLANNYYSSSTGASASIDLSSLAKDSANPIAERKPPQSAPVRLQSNGTTSTKTYINTHYGFSIEYPPGSEIEVRSEPSEFVFKGTYGTIFVLPTFVMGYGGMGCSREKEQTILAGKAVQWTEIRCGQSYVELVINFVDPPLPWRRGETPMREGNVIIAVTASDQVEAARDIIGSFQFFQ
ncbi:hypothetical protein LPJ38_01905 [Bradyrhizobium daqingense]|nr:hypothetical protein [Bradyrhizobium daqingense]UFS89565.1 hypothetical protein LPJ38_01905 [Bradyrhizobium daqingense]